MAKQADGKMTKTVLENEGIRLMRFHFIPLGRKLVFPEAGASNLP